MNDDGGYIPLREWDCTGRDIIGMECASLDELFTTSSQTFQSERAELRKFLL